MKLYYEDLIDKYNFGQFTKEEIELFNLSLEYNPQLREEFNFFLKMKYFLMDGNMKKLDNFLTENKLS